MSAKKNPLSDKAYLMYKQGMKLVDIAEQLGCSSATIRTWKNRYKWDSGGNATFQKQCETKCNVSEREISWVNIEHEYVTDIRKKPCTLEELATKHNIAIGTIEKYSMQHEWSEKRKSYKESIQQKALEKSSNADAERIARLLQIADMATDKAEQALNELEQYVVRDKRKVRTVEYKDNMAISKPTKEVVDEKETVRTEKGPVDRLGLSHVTNALKNIKELYALPVDMESKKYQAELDRRKAEKEGGETTEYESDGFMDALQVDVAATFKEDDAVET